MTDKKSKQKKSNTLKKKNNKSKKNMIGGMYDVQIKETGKFVDSLKMTNNSKEVDELERKAKETPNYPGKFPIPECTIL